jgi:hypothetical protein
MFLVKSLIFLPIIFKNSGVDTSPADPGGRGWTERVNWVAREEGVGLSKPTEY